MSKDLTVVTDNQINKYLESMGNKLTQNHRNQFVEIAKGFNLNPFKREVYGVAYGSNFNIIIGYEVFLKRAETSERLDGWKVWTEGEKPNMKACIEIYRKDRKYPFVHEVYFEEYNQNNQMWKGKPRTMLKKVVIGQGFRMCFPVELGGMPYLAEELKDITPKPGSPTDTENAYSEMIGVEPKVEVVDDVDHVETFKGLLRKLGLTKGLKSFLTHSKIDMTNSESMEFYANNEAALADCINSYKASKKAEKPKLPSIDDLNNVDNEE